MKTLMLPQPIARLRLDGGKVVAFDIGPDGAVYVVVALRSLDFMETKPHGSFPRTRTAQGQSYRVIVIRADGQLREVRIEDEPFNIYLVQPLGNELLLACARSYYRGPDDIEQNGRLYDRNARFARGLVLGDGIESLQTTSSGVIWTSYFDEGIFGNFGWDVPLGSSGLVAWDRDGGRIYEYEPPFALESMVDCYALNVSSDADVWCCYYDDFPLVHIRDYAVVGHWAAPIRGTHAFAVTKDRVLFRGGYADKDAYTLCAFPGRVNDPLEIVDTFVLTDRDGSRVAADRASGRGSCIYLLCGSDVHRLDVRQITEQLTGRRVKG